MSVIEREEVQILLAGGGVQLVEVLPAYEFAESHIPGAVNLPLAELSDERVRAGLRRDEPLVVYCQDQL